MTNVPEKPLPVLEDESLTVQDRSAADGSFRLTNAKDVRYRLQVSELGSLFSVYSQFGVRPSSEERERLKLGD